MIALSAAAAWQQYQERVGQAGVDWSTSTPMAERNFLRSYPARIGPCPTSI